jgi:dihydrofolate synthase/folylpolyglutamate synthase
VGRLNRSLLLAPDRLDRPLSDPLVERLFPELPTGVHWGLERTQRALEWLGDPQRDFRAIHVGGTNGKGSVTTTIASVLVAAGHRAAAYTSPHLCSFRERLLVGGEPLPEEALLGYADEVRGPVMRFGLTFFEASTVLAFHAFREERVEVAAVEVGLGGRLDATNVLRPDVTAVTNVAMDHADYLGDTLGEIAWEKAGIMKPGVPFVTAETDPQALGVFRDLAAAVGARVLVLEPHTVRDAVVAPDRTTFRLVTRTWGDVQVSTPLVGRHQATNAALAVEVLEHAAQAFRPRRDQLLRGIREVRHRGRDEIRLLDGRTWLFDVAHNTAGVESLVDTLDRLELPRPHVVLIGVLGDKDWRSMLPPLFSRADAAVLTVPPSAPVERRWDPVAVAREVGAVTTVAVVEDFQAAVQEACGRAGAGTVIVTGSVHTVGNAMRVLGVDPLA